MTVLYGSSAAGVGQHHLWEDEWGRAMPAAGISFVGSAEDQPWLVWAAPG